MGAAFVGDRIVAFLFLVYVARVLGPEGFGQYLLIGTYVTFFSVTFTAGLVPVAVREMVRRRGDAGAVLGQVLSLRLLLGLAAYAVLLLVVCLVLPAETFLPLAAIAGVALVADAFKDAYGAYHNAQERMEIPAAFQLLASVLAALAGASLLYFGFGLLALIGGGAAANLLVVLAWHAFFARRFPSYRIRFAFAAWKQLLVLIAPIAPLQLAVQFNRLASVMMLSLVGGPLAKERAVGYFGPAQQIANFPLGLLFGLRRAIVPPVAHKLHSGERIDEEFAAALKVALVFFAFPLFVATSLLATEILVLVLGAGYVEAAPTLRLLGVAAAFWITATIPETFLIAFPERNVTRFLGGALMPLMLNVALCAALIPIYSIEGAAAATLAGRAAHLAFALYYCYALLPVARVRAVRFAVPLAVLGAAYAACGLAALSIEALAPRMLSVALLAACGMIAAGRRELAGLAAVAFRRTTSDKPRLLN